MQHLEVSCAVRRLYKSLGVKGLIHHTIQSPDDEHSMLRTCREMK